MEAERQCSTGKIPFGSERKAEKVCRKIRAREQHSRINVYQCSECGKWHLGNTSVRIVLDRLEADRRLLERYRSMRGLA
jgi:hypothetical protein